MSTSQPHNEDVEIKLEITETSQDEAPTQQQAPKVIQNHTDQMEFQSDQEASPSEPQEKDTKKLPVKKPRLGRLKKEKVPLTETEKLIQLVRCMRCLYDPEHPYHRDKQVRGDLWDIIGNAMNLPGNECEKRWSILKKKFKYNIKNKKKGIRKIPKSLVWYEQYVQTIIDREMKKSYPDTSDEWLDDWQTTIEKFMKSKSKHKNRDFNDMKWLLRCICKEEAELKVAEIVNQKRNSNFNEEVTFLHAKQCQCNTATFADPMQKFLAEIATKLKKLSKQEQNLAKLEIFEIVHKFDLKKSTELTVTGIKTEIDID